MGIRVRGDAVQVWQGGGQIGNVYRYELDGKDGKWQMGAAKHRLVPGFSGGECEFRFALSNVSGLVLCGTGQFQTDVTPDGNVHRAPVQVIGTRLWTTTEPERSASNLVMATGRR